MFLLSAEDLDEIPASLDWKNFKELCSVIVSLYLPDFSQLYFLEKDDNEIKAILYDPIKNISIPFEKVLQDSNYFLFDVYKSIINKARQEKYPDLFTAWFYSQIRFLNKDIKISFYDGKLMSNYIDINKNDYNITYFFILIFNNEKIDVSNFDSIHKNIYILKKYIDSPFYQINKQDMLILEKNILSIIRFIRYYSKSEIESIIIKYMFDKCEDLWFIKLHQMKLINSIDEYINDVIFQNRNDLFNYLLTYINNDFIEKHECLHFCCENSKYSSALSLLKKGVNINHKSTKGITPLMISARLVDEKMVEILLNNHADLELEDNYGIIASEKIPNFDFANRLFDYMEQIRKNNKGA